MGRKSVTLEMLESHALGGFGDLQSSLMAMLDSQIAAIRVETTYGPPIYIPSPFRKEAKAAVSSSGTSTEAPPPVPGQPSTVISGQGFDAARILKPKITVEMTSGGDPIVVAPYGDPGPSKWGWVVGGIFAVMILAGYGGIRLGKDVVAKRRKG